MPRNSWSTRILLALCASIPFQFVYWKPFLVNFHTATGFIEVDMPYYVANARATFERGDGIFYPNSFDCDKNAPAIYFHWLLWIVGFCITRFGWDPGLTFGMVGVISTFTFFLISLLIFEHVCKSPERRFYLFLMFCWGGGIYCISRVIYNFATYHYFGPGWTFLDIVTTVCHPSFFCDSLLSFDPGYGWWFQSWGRATVFPTEATYHACAAASWLCFMKERNWLAITCIGVLAATHPFSGIQLLLIGNAWLFVLLCWKRDLKSAAQLLSLVSIMAGFLWYYFIYLERFEQHRTLHERWSIEWNLDWQAFFLGYGPVLLLAGARLFIDWRYLTRTDAFLGVCAVISFLLMKHDMFRAILAPRQPLHFTRGYTWGALALLGMPLALRCFDWLKERLDDKTFRHAMIAITLVWCSDNLGFVGQAVFKRGIPDSHWLSVTQREMLSYINKQKWSGVLLCPDNKLSYLVAAYTPMRTFYGHGFSTEDFLNRAHNTERWFYQEQVEEFPMIKADYLLFPASITPPIVASQWQEVHRNSEWILLKRR